MTSANVFNLSSVNQGQKLNANAATSKTKAGNSSAAVVFSSMMDVNYSTNANADDIAQTSVKTVQTDRAQDSYSGYSYPDRGISTVTITDKMQAASDKLEDLDQKVVAEIAEALGVDEETVRSVMDELGLTVFGLMEPQNLVQLTVELTDASSPEDLLFQPQFVELKQEMQTVQTEFMNQMELMPDEMQELIAQMQVVETPEAVDNISFAELTQQITDGNVEQTDTGIAVESDTAQIEQEVDGGMNVSEVVTDDTKQSGQDGSNAESFSQREDDVQTADRTNAHATEQTPGMVFSTDQVVDELLYHTEEASYVSIDTMDLIEQFAENVKVTVSQGASSMEMQLNPENLGKVYLQISSKEGEIHAQIAASDEAIKNALETQVAELRASLHQAGVKVNSIEVTVASHEFERNLEQGQSREFEEGQRQQEQQSQRRNIRISSLDELSSIMTEEEMLVAQIMKDNGNSVDLTA